MGRSTRLFQQTGSPLIQGSSKSVRPWWQALVGSACLGLVAPAIVWWYSAVADGSSLAGAVVAALRAWFEHSPAVLLGAIAGALLGVVIANDWGARRRWIPGGVLAVVGSTIGVWALGMLTG